MARTGGEVHRVNAGYTLLVRLVPDRVDTVAALLAEMDADRTRLPFGDTTTTHFATVTIIPEQKYGEEVLPATLLVATSYCGPTAEHVRELVDIVGPGLRELLEHCYGFIPGCSRSDLEAFIRDHRHGDTFYSGMQHLSPEDVRNHKRLREAIEAFVDDRQAHGGLPGGALATQRAIQDHIRSLPGFEWADQPFEPPPSAFWALHWRTLVVYAVAATYGLSLAAGTVACAFVTSSALATVVKLGWVALAAVIAFLGILVVGVRYAESQQEYVSGRQPDDHVRELAATQNRPVINEFTIAGPIKEGVFRPLTLTIAMWIVARLAEGLPWWRPGINIPIVATARWIAADGGRRLIFISNYTNAAEPYVRDFIDVKDGAMRINLTFGFGRGYPKTRWGIYDGALTDPNGFIYVVTENQQRTAFWYGPYRDISIDNIKLDRKIREGLFAHYATDDDAQKWLSLL